MVMSGPDNNSTVVVGIGASAGGVSALQRFFRSVQDGKGLCFVVVQHLLAGDESLMDQILGRCTPLPVHQVTEPVAIRENCVYLICPGTDLLLEGDQLVTRQRSDLPGPHLPIDLFFESLADNAEDRSVGIVLSGKGSDGTRGAVRIREAGGLVLAQDPCSADFRAMPSSVIQAGQADFVLHPEQMPEKLRSILQSFSGGISEPELEQENSREDFEQLRKSVLRCSGLDLGWYKASTLNRRIGRRMAMTRCRSLHRYAQKVQSEESEAQALAREILIGVTKFFRDRQAFDLLERETLCDLVDQAAKEERPLRLWDVGCSTGEEAYSLAMKIYHLRDRQGCPGLPVKIFATDVNAEALRYAGEGVYPDSTRKEVCGADLSRFFDRREEGYRIVSDLRKMVVFAQHNALSDPPFGRIDLILCRNVLIYFQPEAQQQLLRSFQFSLRNGGVLMLGPSESLGPISEGFSQINSAWKIYRNLRPARLPMSSEFNTDTLDRSVARFRSGHDSSLSFAASGQGEQERLIEALVEGYVPAAAVVEENGDISRLIGDIGTYVRIRPGRAELNLIRMLPPDVAATVSAGIRRCRSSQEEVVYPDVFAGPEGSSDKVDLRIRPVGLPNRQVRHWIVFFDETPSRSAGQEVQLPSGPEGSTQDPRIEDLHRELQSTRENLQATLEEMQSSNEELQAANEELTVSNEELQSTNEELHSVNEELHTVNEEYQRKIEELTQLTEDLENITRTNQVGTIFLDDSGRVRKFTAPAQRFVHLLARDENRPFEQISHDLDYPEFLRDVQSVANQARRIEKQIPASGDRFALVRIDPYQDEKGARRGHIVITLVDVTELARAQEALKESRKRFRETFNLAAAGIVHVDRGGSFLEVNPRFADMVGYSVEELKGMSFREITDNSDLPLSETVVSDLVSGNKDSTTVRKLYRRKDGTVFPALLTTRFLTPAGSGESYFLSVIQDLSKQEQAEAARRHLASIVDSTRAAIYSTDTFGRILSWNAGAQGLYGYEESEALGADIHMLQESGRFERLDPLLQEVLRGQSVSRHVTSATDKSGQEVWAALWISPIYRENQVAGVSFVAEDLTEQFRIFHRLQKRGEYIHAVWNQPGRLHCVVDTEGRILHFNDACEILTGFAWPEVQGRRLDEILLSRKETEPVEEVLRRHREGVDHLQHDNTWLDAQGNAVAIHWESIALRDPQGHLEYILGIGSRRQPLDSSRGSSSNEPELTQ